MPAPSHLAAFRQGELRFVFAAPRDGAPLFELEDGRADELRAWAKASLQCPIPGCPSPAITTVNRSTWGRDGFRHATAGIEHDPESWLHLEGKGQLAAWARRTYPQALVTEEKASKAERERVADVMVEFPDGKRAALEMQYSSLSLDIWEHRHASYRRQDILDVWLFGHAGEQFNSVRGGSAVRMSRLHERVVEEQVPLLWLNPVTREVKAVAPLRVVHRGVAYDTHPATGEHAVTSEPLDAFRLTDDGLLSPRLGAIAASHRAYTAALVTQGLLAAAADARRAEGRARDAAAAREAQEAEERRLAAEARARVALDQAWLASDEALAVVRRFRGSLPRWLGVDIQIGAVAAREWQWHVFSTCVDTLPPGSRAPLRSAIDALQARYGAAVPDETALAPLVRDFYLRLERSSYLLRAPVANAVKTGHLVFYRPVRSRLPNVDGTPGAHEQRLIDAKAEARASLVRSLREPQAPAAQSASPALGATSGTCRKCRKPLDAALATAGVHIGCALGLR